MQEFTPMQEFPAATLTRDPTALKEAARKGPVTITEHKKPRFVIMSYEAYLKMSGQKIDPRRVFATQDMPADIKALALEALDQPYDP